ncbi:MAG TPA: hypothetical protein VGE07_27270 [Herpetosiphonaceae bacterium]
MIRRLGVFMVLAALVLSVFVAPSRAARASVAAAAPTPTLIAEVNGAGKGRVWVGAVPPNSGGKPVLVFVHGLHGKATNWWGPTTYSGTNDMYDKAYASGYRTAFVSLDDEVDGPASSVWANGSTFNRQLDVILRHYGVSSVNVIAHSKGGADTNSALVHYGASRKVQNIVTLSSPHHGSQLADLAYSWWAGWLASLLGQKDDGTYSMQMGQMSAFRSQTDGRAENANFRYHTSGGTNHGSLFSAMWFGGAYLPGDNDGVVTVISSNHPRQYSRLFTANLNHDNIRKGSDVWTRIEPSVRSFWRTSLVEPTAKAEAAPQAAPVLASDSILRGGQLAGDTELLRLPVEGGASQVSFDLISDRADLQVTFVDPQGAAYPAAKPAADDELFRGGFHYSAQVGKPVAGQWTVELRGAPGAGYLLTAQIDSALRLSLQRDQALLAPGAQLSLQVATLGKAPARSLNTEVLLTGTAVGRELPLALPTQLTASAAGAAKAQPSLALPQAAGLYQLAVTVTGTAADGTAFERSFATSLPVVDAATAQKAALLPAGR